MFTSVWQPLGEMCDSGFGECRLFSAGLVVKVEYGGLVQRS